MRNGERDLATPAPTSMHKFSLMVMRGEGDRKIGPSRFSRVGARSVLVARVAGAR